MEAGAQAARSRALAVLRVRGRALGVAVLPAAAAVILLSGGSTGHFAGPDWDVARWAVSALALLVLLVAAGIGLVVARARPAVTPTVPVPEESAPDLYRMVRDLAERLDVPVPSAIALTPDCDSWLEDRTHPAHGPPAPKAFDEITGPGRRAQRRTVTAPVLVIGSPFLWWMRVGELRAVLAPVVAGTGPSAHPDIAAARRFVRGLDAAVAVAATPGRCPLTRGVCAGLGWVARLLLRGCREHAAQMERGVAAAAAERAQAVDYGLRIVAQEQVGLAYAGWDRLLTRVALPAWRMGRWPSRLDAGVVAALTELSRRDRLAEGFASRLGERPACDLLEEPGAIDEAASLLAARLFHGGPAEPGPDWAPVGWQEYPEEVVDRTWRTDAARLHRVLDSLGVRTTPDPADPGPGGPTLARVMDHLTDPHRPPPAPAHDTATGHSAARPPEPKPTGPATGDAAPGPAAAPGRAAEQAADAQAPVPEPTGPADPTTTRATAAAPGRAAEQAADAQAPVPEPTGPADPTTTRATAPAHDTATGHTTAAPAPDSAPVGPAGRSAGDGADAPAAARADAPSTAPQDAPARTANSPHPGAGVDDPDAHNPRSVALAAGLSAELAREEAGAVPKAADPGRNPDTAASAPAAPVPASAAPTPLWDDCVLPLFPLQPPRGPRELLADHVTAMVCCAAVDTAGAVPGLDWLDGPSLLLHGERAADLTPRVLSLVEDGDPGPLRAWLAATGIRPEKPVRLV
ncbi:hypothetical protein [Streptomyces sp. NPDC006739]|uniref:hypothetical protein n=1 Tax=Streptomyces sp. NPDC006739 TaxID=3364763 RepID=UPI0036CC975A